MKIKLQTINLQVANPEAARQFYTEALGMAENSERSHGPDFFYLESAACHLTVAKKDGAHGPKPSETVELGFQVDDISRLQSHLREKNVNGFKPQRMGWGEVLEGHDPDGHRIIIYSLNER